LESAVKRKDDFCHHPLKQGFDYFYGLPLSNAKDYGDDGEGVLRSQFKRAKPHRYNDWFWRNNSLLLSSQIRYLPSTFDHHSAVIAYFDPLSVSCCKQFKDFNAIVMRNFDVVEQPIRFRNFSQRLVNEGVQFIEKNNADRKPFLLMMSWIQVHTVLHTSEEFRGHSKHGPYGDNVEEMDWSVGEILHRLERLGILNNTFVYFTSDNGGHLEEKGRHGNQEGGWNGIYRGKCVGETLLFILC
jgi:steryl-sulfatase